MNIQEIDEKLQNIRKATKEIGLIAEACKTIGLGGLTDKLYSATNVLFASAVGLEATKETVTELEELKSNKQIYDFDEDIPF